MSIDLKSGVSFLDGFPTRVGITLNSAGDFGNLNPHDELTHNNMLKNSLGVNQYCKMLTTNGDDNAKVVFAENCSTYSYCGGMISFDNAGTLEALFSVTADSPIIVLTARERKLIAIINSGWRATEKNIVGKTIGIIGEKYGINGSEISAGVFPGICGRCYVVDDEVGKKFSSAYDSAVSKLDLNKFITSQLLDAGIGGEKIHHHHLCSYHSRDNSQKPILFSYRENKTEKRNCVFIAR